MKISALLSTYNNEHCIRETIDSVLNQSYTDFEFIIINDGSTDKTKEILESYTDNRIKLIHLETNNGIPNALNMGIEHCKGEFVIKIDGDDVQHPERFEKQYKYMMDHPDCAISKCLFEYFPDNEDVGKTSRYKFRKQFDEKNKNNNKTSSQITEALKWHCSVSHTTMIIKTDIFKKYKYRNFSVFEDYDMFYRLMKDNLLFGHLEELLVSCRVSNESTTGVKDSSYFNKIAYEIKSDILDSFKENENIYIWGTGSYAMDLTELLEEKEWIIQGYIDSNQELCGKSFLDKFVSSPSIINDSRNIKVVIAATTGFYQIAEYLKSFQYETDRDFVVIR